MVIQNPHITEFHSEFFADLKRKYTKPTTCPVFKLGAPAVKAELSSTSTQPFKFDADNAW